MKTKLLLLAAFITGGYTFAQTTQTVSMGANYVNENYYTLSDGNETSVVRDNWDLAFASDGLGGYAGNIRINGAVGTELYKYSNDISEWATVDTTGFSWSANQRINSDTSWTVGAFENAPPVDAYDMGWGAYNDITHIVEGDKIFILKLSDGSARKLIIEKLQGGIYSFKYAMLDGANEVATTVDKSNYSGKNFGYYSIQNGAALDREPASTSWDLVFTKYVTDLGGGTYFGISGVLANADVKTAKAYPVNDVNAELPNGQSYTDDIGAIGYDWKTYNYGLNQYDIEDSLVYFVEVPNQDIYRIIFTEFGGGANGNFIFTKELVGSTVGVEEAVTNNLLNVYPNPATSAVNLTFIGTENTVIDLFDLTGKLVLSKNTSGKGLNQETLDVSNLTKGIYFLTLTSTNSQSTQKLIIK